jgi:predicted dehydrogenase
MADNYRVGVIGHTGRGNYGHGVDTVWLSIPQAKIVGVADPDAEGLKAASARLSAPVAEADYRKLLDEQKPQIVSICPRFIDRHLELVLAAAERGIHIYMEKPFCRTLEEADQIVAACEKNKVKLAIAHQTRYSPKLQAIRDVILDGKIGDVLELRGRGKEDQRGGGEDLWVLGSHIMNLIHHFGGEPRWCFATVTERGLPIRKQDVKEGAEGIGPLAGDSVSAMYQLEDGVTAYFASRRNTAGGRFGLQILGSKGAIDLVTGSLPAANLLPDPQWSPGRSGKNWIPISSAGAGEPEPLKWGSGQTEGNIAACLDLIAAIEEDRQPECSMYEARTTIEMIAAVFESQRLGKPVEIPLATRKNPLTLL